jgi:peptide/nickel transport system substrate-binding protein
MSVRTLPSPPARRGARAARRLGLACVMATLLGALAHCGKREPSGAAATLLQANAKAAAGGELVFGFDGASLTTFPLDPEKSAFAPHHRVMRSIFDSLVVALPEHRFGPWLAKSWEVSPDGKTYTFRLRDDVTFHDGTRFDAEAVKFNLDRCKDPKNALYALSDIGSYASSSALDPYTVEVTFTEPYAPFLANLAKTSLGMVSPAAVKKYGEDFPRHPVGTGPFRLKSIDEGTEIALERNPDYRWPPAGSAHEGPAYLERLVFRDVPEEETRVAVLLNGQAGAVDLIPPQNVAMVRSSADYQLIAGELLNYNYSLFLNAKRAPWSDAQVRKAFRLSLDLDSIVKTVYLGTTARAWSPLSPSIFGYDKTLEGSWKPDPAAASRILDSLGWVKGADGIRVKDGKPLRVVVLDSQGNREKRLDVLTLVRRQVHDVGFELRIDSQPIAAYLAKAEAGDFDLVAGSLFAPDPDVLRRIHSPSLRASWSYFRAEDAQLDAWLDDGARETDPSKRAALYARAQERIVDESFAIPVYVLDYTIGARRDVHGIRLTDDGFPIFYDAWIGS